MSIILENNIKTIEEIENIFVNKLTDNQFYTFIHIIRKIYSVNLHTKLTELTFNPFEYRYNNKNQNNISSTLYFLINDVKDIELKEYINCLDFYNDKENNDDTNYPVEYEIHILPNEYKYIELITKEHMIQQKKIFLKRYCGFMWLKNIEPIQNILTFINFYTMLFNQIIMSDYPLELYKNIYNSIFNICNELLQVKNEFDNNNNPFSIKKKINNTDNTDNIKALYNDIYEIEIVINLIKNKNNTNYAKYIKYILLGSLYNKEDSPLKYQIVEYFERIQEIFKGKEIISDNDIKYLFYQKPEDNIQSLFNEITEDIIIPYHISIEKYIIFQAILFPFTNKIPTIELEYCNIFYNMTKLLVDYNQYDILRLYKKMYQIINNEKNIINPTENIKMSITPRFTSIFIPISSNIKIDEEQNNKDEEQEQEESDNKDEDEDYEEQEESDNKDEDEDYEEQEQEDYEEQEESDNKDEESDNEEQEQEDYEEQEQEDYEEQEESDNKDEESDNEEQEQEDYEEQEQEDYEEQEESDEDEPEESDNEEQEKSYEDEPEESDEEEQEETDNEEQEETDNEEQEEYTETDAILEYDDNDNDEYTEADAILILEQEDEEEYYYDTQNDIEKEYTTIIDINDVDIDKDNEDEKDKDEIIHSRERSIIIDNLLLRTVQVINTEYNQEQNTTQYITIYNNLDFEINTHIKGKNINMTFKYNTLYPYLLNWTNILTNQTHICLLIEIINKMQAQTIQNDYLLNDIDIISITSIMKTFMFL